MNLYKVQMNRLLMPFLFVFSLNVFAEEAPFQVFEAFHLQIKLSKDGTGIIKGIECQGCDYKFVKITADSKATVNGVAVDIQAAKRRSGKMAMVSYDPYTQEVQYIRWSE